MPRLLLALLLAALAAGPPPARAQPADDASALVADTSDAALRIEAAHLALARAELATVTSWQRWRPQLGVYVSLSTRGLAFPAVAAQGYDPAYAAVARWPGDAWGLSLSWNADQILDRRPALRARAAADVAALRVELVHARRADGRARQAQQDARALALAHDRADRRARDVRRAALAADALRVETGFLTRRLTAQQDLLRLAEMRYAQGALDYEALARQRLATLAAEHALATAASRLAALDALGPDALPDGPAGAPVTDPTLSASDVP